uniref:Integrase catalytic domain-containing protein n=1 Tax=Tanacetum cinerariifolium TaxID=118510 RepID=A0A6L2KRS9_TANCI|nr:hypothetical protein [Tanacetum cinerariifolium]
MIRCGNKTEFKNWEMNQFCEMKGIMRQYSVARTPQQNGVAKKRNMTLIEAARTMLADSKLPTTFWAEAVNTACYKQLILLAMYKIERKFDGKADKGFFIGYSLNGKAFRVFNNRTRIVEENLHIRFSENTPNFARSRPNWLFDIDVLTKSINYKSIIVGNESNDQEKEDNVNNTNNVNVASTNGVNAVGENSNNELSFDPKIPELEDFNTFTFLNKDEDDGVEAYMNIMDTTIQVSPTPTIRIHKDHPIDQMIGDLHSTTQTRNMYKNLEEHRNKKDKRGIMIKSKARLVNHGYTQEERIDYDEIKEEVYVCQPPRFEDLNFPDKVYKVEKALYGLHQAPRAWQDKYVAKILKKYDFSKVKNASTPIETYKPLFKDKDEEEVDVHMYRSMIGSLMYLTSSRPDIMFVFWTTVKAKTINGEAQIHAKVDGKKVIISEAKIRRDLQFGDEGGVDCLSNEVIFEQLALMGYEKLTKNLTFYKAFFSLKWKFLIHTILQCLSAKTTAWNEFSSTMASTIICLATNQKFNISKYIFESMVKNWDSVTKILMYLSVPIEFVADEAVNEEMNDSLERDTTTATSLDAEQDRGNIFKTQYKATSNEPSSQETSSGGGPKRQDTMRDIIAQTRYANVSKCSNDLLLVGVNTPQSREDSLKLAELMELCTNLQNRVLDLETTKTTQAIEVESLKRRVKNLEKRQKSRTHKLKRLHKVGLSGRNNDEEMFDTCVFDDVEVFAKQKVAAKNLTVDEVTSAQALMGIKSTKPNVKGIVLQEPDESTTTTTTATMTKVNLAWDDVHAKIKANYELAQRLQAEEQDELTDAEKARLFMEFLEKRRKFFAARELKRKGIDHQLKLNKEVLCVLI